MTHIVPQQHRTLIIVLLLILSAIWGSSFILMKRALLVLSAPDIAALRMFFATVMLLPFAVQGFRRVDRSMWGWIILQGFLGAGLPALLFVTAQQFLPSAITGMLNAMTPIVTLIVASLVFGVHPTQRQMAGILIGFVGAVILISGDMLFSLLLHQTGQNITLSWHAGLVVLATVCYGFSVNISRQKFMHLQPADISIISYIVYGGIGGLLAWYHDVPTRLLSHPDGMRITVYLFILGGIGSGVASLMFNRLIQISNALIASSVTYLIPVVAIAWGLADGEVLTIANIAGIGIILAGVYLVNVSKKS